MLRGWSRCTSVWASRRGLGPALLLVRAHPLRRNRPIWGLRECDAVSGRPQDGIDVVPCGAGARTIRRGAVVGGPDHARWGEKVARCLRLPSRVTLVIIHPSHSPRSFPHTDFSSCSYIQTRALALRYSSPLACVIRLPIRTRPHRLFFLVLRIMPCLPMLSLLFNLCPLFV
ncbi:hypothetical protein C8J57DRAFT_1343343, partial [Mycena rebaudengoi]